MLERCWVRTRMYWKQTSVYHPWGSRGPRLSTTIGAVVALMVRESEKVMGLSTSTGRDCRWGEWMTSALFHPQYHDCGETLEQGTEPPTALQAPQQKNGCSLLQVYVHGVCVCSLLSAVCALGWVKCRRQILSMGHVTFFPFYCIIENNLLLYYWIKLVNYQSFFLW